MHEDLNTFLTTHTLLNSTNCTDQDGLPQPSGWPLDLRYATGISIVELERRLPNGSYMSAEFIKSPEFAERHSAAVSGLKVPKGTSPGTLQHMTAVLQHDGYWCHDGRIARN